jgi:uncharacterized membrane protein
MVFMALDHVRDFVTELRFQPEDLARSSAALFATRWVTHFCAPAFFLLAGIGIGISRLRGESPGAQSRYLLVRGLWLLVLELIITPIGWQFGFDLIPAFALVLWALGWSMIVMALAVHLPVGVVAAMAVVTIGCHNLLDPVLFVGYPLVPWIGVMALGYALADLYGWTPDRRRKFLVMAGAAAVVAFIALRAVNGYGNTFPWSEQRTSALTVASFLNLRKYPPSLQFLLMTLGPTLIFLALAERLRGGFANFLSVYGRVPLFFYVAHIFVAHAVAMLLAFAQGGEWRRIQIISAPQSIPDWYGVSLPGVYAAWATVVLVLYYPCRRFSRLKDTRTDWWLRYL